VAVLTKEVLDQHLKRLPPYLTDILTTLAQRLQHTDSMVHPHVTSDCTAMVLKQLRLIMKDRFGEQVHKARMPLDAVVEEISHDLGISALRVVNALLSTHHLKLLQITPDKFVRIPNVEQLTQYTQYVQAQSREEKLQE
jgi:hypothetical protein